MTQKMSVFKGEVVQGNRMGHKLGFPTANLSLLDNVQFPTLNGVYSVHVSIDDHKYFGVMNIGVSPTFKHISKEKTFEVHILNFAQDIYGQTITVEICRFIRREKRFKTIDALKEQLQQDCLIAKQQLQQQQLSGSYLQRFSSEINLDVIHLPDLDFVRFCEQSFRINRGVYNTIDKWFADNQTMNIVWRRTLILRFLYWVTDYLPKEERLEFGIKGLTEQLTCYCNHQVLHKESHLA